MLMRHNGTLTRQGRLTRTFVGLLVLAAAVVVGPRAFAESSVPAEVQPAPVYVDTYVVMSGESLWEIASSLTPVDGDVRSTLAHIKSLNEFSDSSIVAGQQILIPVIA